MKRLLLCIAFVLSFPIFADFSSNTENTPKGSTVTLSWSSTAASCTGSGAWSGSKAASGTEQVVLPQEGWNLYVLNCGGVLEYLYIWGTAEVSTSETINNSSSSNSTSSIDIGGTESSSNPGSGTTSTSSSALVTGNIYQLDSNTTRDFEVMNWEGKDYLITLNKRNCCDGSSTNLELLRAYSLPISDPLNVNNDLNELPEPDFKEFDNSSDSLGWSSVNSAQLHVVQNFFETEDAIVLALQSPSKEIYILKASLLFDSEILELEGDKYLNHEGVHKITDSANSNYWGCKIDSGDFNGDGRGDIFLDNCSDDKGISIILSSDSLEKSIDINRKDSSIVIRFGHPQNLEYDWYQEITENTPGFQNSNISRSHQDWRFPAGNNRDNQTDLFNFAPKQALYDSTGFCEYRTGFSVLGLLFYGQSDWLGQEDLDWFESAVPYFGRSETDRLCILSSVESNSASWLAVKGLGYSDNGNIPPNLSFLPSYVDYISTIDIDGDNETDPLLVISSLGEDTVDTAYATPPYNYRGGKILVLKDLPSVGNNIYDLDNPENKFNIYSFPDGSQIRAAKDLGDLDGDGLDELLVSLTNNKNESNNHSWIVIIRGTTTINNLEITEESTANYSVFNFGNQSSNDRYDYALSNVYKGDPFLIFDYDGDGTKEVLLKPHDGGNTSKIFRLISPFEKRGDGNSSSPNESSTGSASSTDSSSDSSSSSGSTLPAESLTYSLSGTDASHFTIDQDTGGVSFTSAPSYTYPSDANNDNEYEITVKVSSGLANAPPVFGTFGSNSVVNEGMQTSIYINENKTSVGSLSVTDIDSSSLTYTLSGNDSSYFAVSSSGEVTLTEALDFETPLDFDADNVYSFTVTVSDGSNSVTKDLLVNIQDVAELQDAGALSITVDENSETFEIGLPQNAGGIRVYTSNGYAGKDSLENYSHDLDGKETVTLGNEDGSFFILNDDKTYSSNEIVRVISDIQIAPGVTLKLDGASMYGAFTGKGDLQTSIEVREGNFEAENAKIRTISIGYFDSDNPDSGGSIKIKNSSIIGVDFTPTTGHGSWELLNNYFEGMWNYVYFWYPREKFIIKGNVFYNFSTFSIGFRSDQLQSAPQIMNNIFVTDDSPDFYPPASTGCSKDLGPNYICLWAARGDYNLNLEGNAYLHKDIYAFGARLDTTNKLVSNSEYFGVTDTTDISNRYLDSADHLDLRSVIVNNPVSEVNTELTPIFHPKIVYESSSSVFRFAVAPDYEAGSRQLTYTIEYIEDGVSKTKELTINVNDLID